MSRILWMQAMRGAWTSYVKKMNKNMKPDKFDRYLNQEIDMGMKLEEFAESVFIQGFVAGEKYAKSFTIGTKKCEPELN
ncbi:MAG: hypothetical protein HGB00_09115 [Chlorobiaceae bacterium]|nr:hypothetical protein [Chlorobiaceae bacterium]